MLAEGQTCWKGHRDAILRRTLELHRSELRLFTLKRFKTLRKALRNTDSFSEIDFLFQFGYYLHLIAKKVILRRS